MLLYIDCSATLDLDSIRGLNFFDRDQLISISENLKELKETDTIILTICLDTDSGFNRISHVNGLAIVYNDYVETSDEYLNE